MKTPIKKRYEVLSPDGFAIDFFDQYTSIKEARAELKKWMKGYKIQGHYSSMRYGRIPYSDIPEYCEIIEIPDQMKDIKKPDRLYHALIHPYDRDWKIKLSWRKLFNY